MADKNIRFVLSIFGMLIAAGLILLATVLVSQAQDFEPDRRPEAGSECTVTFDAGAAADTSYTPLTATAYGSFPAGVAPSGFAVLDGSAGQFVSLAASSRLHTSPRTESFWIRIESSYYANYPNYLGGSYYSGGVNYGSRTVYSDAAGGPVWQIEVGQQGLGPYYSLNPYMRPVGSWNHLCLTHDASRTRVYINGVKAHDSAQAGATMHDGNLFEYTFGGSYNRGTSNSGVASFDTFQSFSRCFSDAEVASLFQSGRTGQGDNQP